MVRFENLDEKFLRYNEGHSSWNVDLHKFLAHLYDLANPGQAPKNIKVEEMDLQGVHLAKGKKQYKWLAQGAPASEQPDALILSQEQDQANLKQATLAPQALRTFRVTYSKEA